jgi:hypothetical protein
MLPFKLFYVQFLGIHKSTVCRTIKKVTMSINKRLRAYIAWPNNPQELRANAIRFSQLSGNGFGIANVCGVVDGTHVNIKAPSENEPQFINRHHNHSINVMIICGPTMKIFYISARWPGSVNDSRVLRNSIVYADFEAGRLPFENAIVLGDSIYPEKQWLVPMIPRAPANVQAYYQYVFVFLVFVKIIFFFRAHAKTRRIVENSIALWKNRWQVLKAEIRVDTPEYASMIIKSTAYLHNFMMTNRVEEEDDDDDYLDNL